MIKKLILDLTGRGIDSGKQLFPDFMDDNYTAVF